MKHLNCFSNNLFKNLPSPRSSALVLSVAIPCLLQGKPALAQDAPDPVTPDAGKAIEEILVTADFRPAPLMNFPASISVIDEQAVKERSAQHIEHVLNLSANVNYSAGASRGRFVQIRGIGERSQFVDPINPSVGLIIDGVDYSNNGTAGTLFDVEQIEVLRGPQGTRMGNDALAGLIQVNTGQPTKETEAYVEAGVGNYAAQQVGAVISGALSDVLLGRLAVQQFQGDGYTDNDFLNRDDTQDFDELTLRGKLRWLIAEDTQADLTLFYADIDNGYDAFSLDNNRNTLSDQPGFDRQETEAVALAVQHDFDDLLTLETQVAYSQADLDYGFDEDWSFVGIAPGLEYSSTDAYFRERDNLTLDVRLLSGANGRWFNDQTAWVLGFYFETQDESLNRVYAFNPGPFDTDTEVETQALYLQTDTALNERLNLTVGLRVEEVDVDYADNLGTSESPSHTLFGVRLGLDYLLSDSSLAYVQLTQAEKSGSVNGNALANAIFNGFTQPVQDFLRQRLEFDKETLTSLEAGYKSSYLEDRLQLRVSGFYMWRKDMQLRVFVNQGTQFVGYIDNVDKGINYGLELETEWQATEHLNLFASLGWLETEIADTFLVSDPDSGQVDRDGREQAHAPNYQASLGAVWTIAEPWKLRVEWEGKDSFFFSNSHNSESSSYGLVNLSLQYSRGPLELSLWSRNLFDKDYAVRGFRFGNDPRDGYINNTYVQFGEPQVFGLTGSYKFQ